MRRSGYRPLVADRWLFVGFLRRCGPTQPIKYCHSRPCLRRDRLRRESRENKTSVNKRFYVYILASKRNGTLYTGITSNLIQREWQHKNNIIEGFTQKYNVKTLVFYEVHDNVESAIAREKRIKKWRRAWKLQLIERMNPEWNDLFEEICQ